MAMVDLSELLIRAREDGYCVPAFEITDLAVLAGVADAAERTAAPVVLVARPGDTLSALLPALEAAAKRAKTPMALVLQGAESAAAAVEAVRLGCNGVSTPPGAAAEVAAVMNGCGVAVIRDGGGDGAAFVGVELAEAGGQPQPAGDTLIVWNAPADMTTPPFAEAALLELTDHLQRPWVRAVHGDKAGPGGRTAAVRQAVAEAAAPLMEALGAGGRGAEVLAQCRRWRPVEHLILFNVDGDEAQAEGLAAEGRAVLSQIPGVQAALSGRAVKADAQYQWCWLIRFAHPEVIPSYRDHPDHAAYADQRFRPLAADRISIDFALEDAAEGG